ncbi:MAG: 6-carboxytetrahydropterin synthase [Candidatus Cloacimonetes bacterium]|nr:6-carboxytetrahydropterin synthase [Candidatus Cloacimonadota bacterium]
MILKTKKYSLHCHHRLISKQLSHQENLKVFSKCMGQYGHGHEYLVRLSFFIQSNDFELEKKVDQHIDDCLITPFSYQSINQVFDSIGVDNSITTGEQIVKIFALLLQKDPLSECYYKIEVVETRKNSFFHFFENKAD